MGKVVEMNAERGWNQICSEQQWNDQSQIIHLEGFLRDKGLFEEFSAYAATAAKEENEMSDSSNMSSSDQLN